MKRTLEITTRVGCANRCIYCPQDVLLKNYSGNYSMTQGHFVNILYHTPKNIQIDFTGFCEPFYNPWASWMMRYAIEHGYKVVLITTLSGFSENDAMMISGLKFEKVMIHEFEGTPINYDEFNEKEQWLRKAVGEVEKFKLTESFRWSRAGNLWDTEIKHGKIECGWTGKEFYRNVVLPNGDVYLCCMDYGLKHRLGNIIVTHYNDLNRNQIIELCNSKESDLICRKCEMCKNI